MTPAEVSYLSAAVAYLLLGVLLLTSWRGRLQGALLLGAVWLSVLWAAVQAFVPLVPGRGAMLVLEVLRDGAWIVFFLRLLRHRGGGGGRNFPAWAKVAAPLVALPSLLGVGLLAGPFVAHLLLVLSSLAGIILLEQVFRNTRPEYRWGIKHLFMGIGFLFAYDFFLFAHTLLFGTIDQDLWIARGGVNVLVVPLIMLSAARNPQWSLDVFVSRKVVFHTASVLGAGGYLLLMGGAGYYIREFGGTWGGVAQALFITLALLLLLAVLFSGQVRAWLRLFLSRNFFSYKYDYRDEWSKLSTTLSSDEEPDPGIRIIKSVAQIVESPAGVLWAVDRNGDFEVYRRWNMREAEERFPADLPLVQWLQAEQKVIEVEDCREHPESYAGLQLPPWVSESDFWLIIPLLQSRQLVGVLVLAPPRVHHTLTWEDRDLLRTVGIHLASHLVLLMTSEELAAARQFEAFNRLSSFVVHDLKNVGAQLQLLIDNAGRHRENPAFVADAFRVIENVNRRINRMLQQLRKGDPGERKGIIDLRRVARQAVGQRRGGLPPPELKVPDRPVEVLVDGERMQDILMHLIQNAQEATPDDGEVVVEVGHDGEEQAWVAVRDNGSGMSEEFMRDSLFRPFVTTKGNAGMGLGVFESREFARSQGGDMLVESEVGKGSLFLLRLPLYRATADDAPLDNETGGSIAR
ncbi:MAG TPA: PEP-CTERM system histidine kinase PrsK [Chloroflexi bacterium]|nr:PEP-CTERM system histidine kinase PrsK [Chloroflexota bacterium]